MRDIKKEVDVLNRINTMQYQMNNMYILAFQELGKRIDKLENTIANMYNELDELTDTPSNLGLSGTNKRFEL